MKKMTECVTTVTYMASELTLLTCAYNPHTEPEIVFVRFISTSASSKTGGNPSQTGILEC